MNLVSLDEEGFLVAVEKFTGREIPREELPEYAPEPSESAEPIAMGRQTIWGGRGKPPGREVMAAAAKAAKQDLMQRMREKKTATPARSSGKPAAPGHGQPGRRPEGQAPRGGAMGRPARSGGGGQGGAARNGNAGGNNGGGNRSGAGGNRPSRAPVQVAR